MSGRYTFPVMTLAIVLAFATSAPAADPKAGTVAGPLREAVERRNAFTASILRAGIASSRGENAVVAPLGIAEILDILREAASGETAVELARLLGPPSGSSPLRAMDPSRPTVRPKLAVELANNDGYGVKIIGVPEDSPEARAGLRAGDLILAFQKQPIRSRTRLADAVSRSEPGRPAAFQVYSYDAGIVVEPKIVLGTESAAMPGLSTTRGLWVQSGTKLAGPFLASLKGAHGVTLFEADFKGQPDAARTAIDTWLASESGGGAIDPAVIEPDTRLVLIDRLLLRATWVHPFPRAESGEFQTLDGTKIAAPMMHQEAIFPYAERKGFRLLELPFDDGRRSFVVLLPEDPKADVPEAGELTAALKAAKPVSVDVALPRFTLETSRRLESDLATLGVKRAFSDDAEFPGLGVDERMKLGAVFQSVKLDVAETGVKAEAVTGASAVAIRGDRAEPKVFRADRPFFFLVVDRPTGLILLAGRKVR